MNYLYPTIFFTPAVTNSSGVICTSIIYKYYFDFIQRLIYKTLYTFVYILRCIIYWYYDRN